MTTTDENQDNNEKQGSDEQAKPAEGQEKEEISSSSSEKSPCPSPDSSPPPGVLTSSPVNLGFAMLAGVLSIIIGVYSTGSNFMYIMGRDLDTSIHSNYDSLMASTGMILCEIIFAITFLILASFFINNADVKKKTPMLIRFTGIARVLLLYFLLASFWKKNYGGWYFILDPDGSNPETILIVGLGFLQGIFLFFGVKKIN